MHSLQERRLGSTRRVAASGVVVGSLLVSAVHADPLPSWNPGETKNRLLSFVQAVTDPKNDDFVPPDQRIAVFDNDGTLWCEQPVYTQFVFAIDRIRELAASHPEWKTTQPFQSVVEGDVKGLIAQGETAVMEVVVTAHTGMTSTEFDRIVRDWIGGARHPKFKHLYTDLTYQPMLEILAFLRANEFKTFIVSGGGIDFMRPWSEQVYGVPPEQVIGSMGKLAYEDQGNQPVLRRLPEIAHVDDGPGKPVGIQMHIGRQPILAFGNSDGDLQMLEYATSGKGARLAVIVRHTDAAREFAYDRKSSVGRLDKALDVAIAQDWTIVDMKRDWRRVFAFEK